MNGFAGPWPGQGWPENGTERSADGLSGPGGASGPSDLHGPDLAAYSRPIPAPRIGSLASGYGGLDLAVLDVFGGRVAWHAESDPDASRVLDAHWPGVPNLGDITAVDWTTVEPVDILTAGFPCQDISAAGRRAGMAAGRWVAPDGDAPCGCAWMGHKVWCEQVSPLGWAPRDRDIHASDRRTADVELAASLAAAESLNERDRAEHPEWLVKGTRSGLWTYVAQAIGALRPRLVVIENVAALLSTHANRTPDGTVEADGDVEPGPAGLGDGSDEHVLRALGAVLGDLAGIGFDAQWTSVAASDVGACHRRRRTFILAWPAADATRDEWPPLREGFPAAAVGGAVRPVDLLPTPAACNPNDGEDLDNWQARREVLAERHGNNGFGMPLGVAVRLLPTPAARLGDSRGQPNAETAVRRMDDEGRRNLDDAVALLPTPRARDHKGRDPNPRGVDLNEAVALMPTPTARLGVTNGNPERGSRSERTATGADLADAVCLLPTPTTSDVRGPGRHGAGGPDLRTEVSLLPTSRATDGSKGGPNQRGSSGDLMLPSAVMDLLPTPTVADSRGSRNATAGRSTDAQPFGLGWSLSDVAHADRWGRYAPAIARWEAVLGRPAPDPTEAGTRGQPRLAARFVEWMQGCPDGWVTSIVGRNAALRILGNGVVPQQGAHALRLLAADREAAP